MNGQTTGVQLSLGEHFEGRCSYPFGLSAVDIHIWDKSRFRLVWFLPSVTCFSTSDCKTVVFRGFLFAFVGFFVVGFIVCFVVVVVWVVFWLFGLGFFPAGLFFFCLRDTSSLPLLAPSLLFRYTEPQIRPVGEVVTQAPLLRSWVLRKRRQLVYFTACLCCHPWGISILPPMDYALLWCAKSS